MTDHVIEQYGEQYREDGRLEKRLRLIHEIANIYDSVDAVKNRWNLIDAHAEALRRRGFLKPLRSSGIERSAPREKE